MRPTTYAAVRLVAVGFPALVAATGLVWLLEERLGLPNASPVYLIPVVAAALLSGTAGAVVTGLAGIATYNFFFTQPYYTFTINDPGEWLSLVLLLFVGLVVGQLAALQRSQTLTATAREREARALFQISRALATRTATTSVLPEIAEMLRAAVGMRATWISLGADDAAERAAARAGPESAASARGLQYVLRRMPGDEPARWIRVHHALAKRRSGAERTLDTFRVRIEGAGETLGSVWGVRERAKQPPGRSESRLLAAAADQIAQLLLQDRLVAEAEEAEIARRSDDLKSALLQAVSHDLRTPLAAIRAAAGSLRPESPLDDAARSESADAIERQVAHLNGLVTNLLDLGRIEAGALRAEIDVFELDDLVGRTIDRFTPQLRDRLLTVDMPPLPVTVDPVLLDEALTNLLDNAVKFTSPGATIRVAAEHLPGEPFVLLVVEDSGPGVDDAALNRIFEPFYRLPAPGAEPPTGRGRSGMGLGLAVARGLVEAMDGSVESRRSTLGGLAVELQLPTASIPASVVSGSVP